MEARARSHQLQGSGGQTIHTWTLSVLPGVSSKALYSWLNPADTVMGKVCLKSAARTTDRMQMCHLCMYAKLGWQSPEIRLPSSGAAVFYAPGLQHCGGLG